MRQLTSDSSLSRALNGNAPPWGRTDHLIADLWKLWAKKEHPVRAEMEARAYREAKQARVIDMRTKFEKRKRAYGLG